LEGAAKVYVTVPLVITLPTKIEVPAPESVYRAKLCGMPLSLLLKLRVTLAFTGTVMVDLSNAIPEAVRLTVTADPTGAAVEVVGAVLEVVGLELVKGGIVIEVEGEPVWSTSKMRSSQPVLSKLQPESPGLPISIV